MNYLKTNVIKWGFKLVTLVMLILMLSSVASGQGEIKKIENFVNSMVDKKSEVKTRIMTPKEAVDNGALALFGEKYGEVSLLK